MKLYQKLPYSVTVNGKRYKINPSFDRILEAVDVLGKEDWTDTQKISYLKWLLIKSRCDCPVDVINAIMELLVQGDSSEPRTLDFAQDSDLIYAAFWQTYGIDLYEERGKLHWYKFSALLSALPEDTRISEIIGIRMQNVPKATKYNQEQRNQIIRLKAKYRIKVSEKEKEEMYQKSMQRLAGILTNMAERGD